MNVFSNPVVLEVPAPIPKKTLCPVKVITAVPLSDFKSMFEPAVCMVAVAPEVNCNTSVGEAELRESVVKVAAKTLLNLLEELPIFELVSDVGRISIEVPTVILLD